MATKFDANKAQNLDEIEKQFAVVAVEHAQTYWNLLESIPPRQLRLTKLDDEIFDHFGTTFPELVADPAKVQKLDEDFLKSEDGKDRWRKFISTYENKVNNYNFGSLIRTESTDEYSQTNSIFVTRMQFFAIEIARNRFGLNDHVHTKGQAEKEKEKEKKEKEKEKH